MQTLGEGFCPVGFGSAAVAMDGDKEVGIKTVGYASSLVELDEFVFVAGQMDLQSRDSFPQLIGHFSRYFQGDDLFEGAFAFATAVMPTMASIQDDSMQGIGLDPQGGASQAPKEANQSDSPEPCGPKRPLK